MSIPGAAHPMLLAAVAEQAAYSIPRSLRFNSSDSAYLSRTPASAGNRKTWTWSGWVKIASFTRTHFFFGASNTFAAFNGGESISDCEIYFNLRGGGTNYFSSFAPKLRDPSAWYHFVFAIDTTQSTASNRLKVYINGVQITAAGSTGQSFPPQNDDLAVNDTISHLICGQYYFDGYLADIWFLDGLTPTTAVVNGVTRLTQLGEFDTNGIWQPKAWDGAALTGNSFHLDFADNSAATAATLGKDTSGLGNNWTPNNLSVTAGAGNDSLVDSPSSPAGQTDSGAGGTVVGNYCTLNPLNTGATSLANGNLEVTTPSTGYGLTYSTIAVSSGKWYWEVFASAITGNAEIGISKAGATLTNAVGMYVGGYSYVSGQFKGNNNSYTSYGASYTTNDIIGVALDLDAGTLVFYKNGVSQGTAFSSLSGEFFPAVSDSSNSGGSTLVANFGARAFSYTAPSGFKALCTANLPTPTIAKGSDYFDAVLYTGNGSTQTISGLNFSPDWVWIKGRSLTSNNRLYDQIRGATKSIYSDLTDAEGTESTGLTAFTSDGFSLGSQAGHNQNTSTYVAWCWDGGSSTVSNTQGSITSQVRANASAGFSVVTWSSTTTVSHTFGHGLGVAPAFVIVKRRSSSGVWRIGHTSLGWTRALQFDTGAQLAADGAYWNNTAPTSTVVYIGDTGQLGADNVAYCFAPVDGYSSFGSYTGNGSADGPFVYTGFRPRWIVLKRAVGPIADWVIHDTARSDYNVSTKRLYANSSDAEVSDSTMQIDCLSNGFKIRNTGGNVNGSGDTYIYAAFAESPFAYARAR